VAVEEEDAETLPVSTAATAWAAAAATVVPSTIAPCPPELAAAIARIQEVETTCARLADEAVRASGAAAAATAAAASIPALTVECAALTTKLAAALELLGEREEKAAELEQDVLDLKSVLAAQAEAVAAARAGLRRRGGA